MKTKFFQICACTFLFMATGKTYSQDFIGKDTKSNTVAYNSVPNKNDLDSTYSLKNVNAVMINDKVAKSFARWFNNNDQQNWTTVGKNYFNRFYSNGILTNALFTRHGRLIYTVKYGTEKNLPAEIRKMIKSEYYDYTILSAIEVEADNRDIWVVKVDDGLEQITVRVEDGEMEQVEQFQKLK